jgi:hypothetical protein
VAAGAQTWSRGEPQCSCSLSNNAILFLDDDAQIGVTLVQPLKCLARLHTATRERTIVTWRERKNGVLISPRDVHFLRVSPTSLLLPVNQYTRWSSTRRSGLPDCSTTCRSMIDCCMAQMRLICRMQRSLPTITSKHAATQSTTIIHIRAAEGLHAKGACSTASCHHEALLASAAQST